jgi:acyl carrier protein
MSREALRKIVADTLQMPLESVPPDASAETLEDWDSLRHLDIVMAIESDTGISFSTAEIVSLTSLEKLEHALRSRGWNP